MSVELNEALLQKAAGWDVVKRARAYLELGQVLSSYWQPPLLRGVVQNDGVSFRASMVIKNEKMCIRDRTNAFNLATDDSERQGVHTHFARVKLKAGQFAEAQAHLDSVTNAEYAELKRRLTRSLADAKEKAAGTNAPASTNTVDRPAAAN